MYYVVPDSQFLYTDSIKHIKGTDASNCHDEELPEEEQEYSDDEKNWQQNWPKRKKKNKKTKDKQTHTSGPSLPNKRQKVSAYSPITTYSQNAVHNRGRQILPQHNTIYSNYGQQQPPQQQQQQSPPVAQYGQPYYPQTDSYNSLMGQTHSIHSQLLPKPTFLSKCIQPTSATPISASIPTTSTIQPVSTTTPRTTTTTTVQP